MERFCQGTCDRHPFVSPPRTESSLTSPLCGPRTSVVSHWPPTRVRPKKETRAKRLLLSQTPVVAVVVAVAHAFVFVVVVFKASLTPVCTVHFR